MLASPVPRPEGSHATTLASPRCSRHVARLAPSAPPRSRLDYDGVAKGDDYRTAPYIESGITTTVNQGHYELYSDATGDDGDQRSTSTSRAPASRRSRSPRTAAARSTS
jgi:hypothetical protein